MPTLTITSFSCIESAIVDLKPITILIGPQASGKSVIAKLFYFLAGVTGSFYESAERGDSFRQYEKNIAQQFAEWFPPSAWGRKAFEISYTAGPFKCTIKRRHTTRRMYDEVTFEFPDFFKRHYLQIAAQYRENSRKTKHEDEFDYRIHDRTWRIRDQSAKVLAKRLGSERIGLQVFVPAARSFFTNLQKTITVFEHGSQLDTATKRFGRLFSELIDGDRLLYISREDTGLREFITRQKTEMKAIFGGDIKLSRNDRHLVTADGRKIPFSILSSGQQELLPLVLTVQYFARLTRAYGRQEHTLLYIEEPEAHLFPTTQGALTSSLAALSNFTAPQSRMFITTHSPYVLSKMNILIKAHVVAKKNEKSKNAVVKIIPEDQWLAPGRVSAYALRSGKLESIQDKSGLIDGEYLDSISSEISEDFMSLMEIGVKND